MQQQLLARSHAVQVRSHATSLAVRNLLFAPSRVVKFRRATHHAVSRRSLTNLTCQKIAIVSNAGKFKNRENYLISFRGFFLALNVPVSQRWENQLEDYGCGRREPPKPRASASSREIRP